MAVPVERRIVVPIHWAKEKSIEAVTAHFIVEKYKGKIKGKHWLKVDAFVKYKENNEER